MYSSIFFVYLLVSLAVSSNGVDGDMMLAVGLPTIVDVRTAHLDDATTLNSLGVGDRVTGLEFDPVEGRLYWATGSGMHSTDTDGNDLDNLNTNASSITIDSPHALMFYANEGLIGVMSLYEFYSKILVNDSEIMPTYLTVDVENRHIYWINNVSSGINSIQRCLYDGSAIEVVQEVDAKGLTLDPIEKRLYYGVGDKLMSSGLNGENITDVWADDNYKNISTVKLFNGSLYIVISNESISTLVRYNMSDGEWSAILTDELGLGFYSDVVVYNTELLPLEENICTINYGDCMYFCLPLPDGEKSCITPDGQTDPLDIEIKTEILPPTTTYKPEIVLTEKPKFDKSTNRGSKMENNSIPWSIFLSIIYRVYMSTA